MRRLTLTHAVLNALLLWLGYYWLGLGESRALTLVWSFLVALVAVSLASVQYGVAFAWFRLGKRPWQTVLRNFLPAIVVAAAGLIVYLLLDAWAGYSSTPAHKVASYLTLKFRKPVRPSTIFGIFNTVLWLVRWVIVPVLLAPLFSAVAAAGWRGFRAVSALERKWLYWLETPLLLLCALWLPLKLLGWVPHFEGFGWQMVSFVVRALAAYALFVAAGLAFALVTSTLKPRAVKAAVS
jgi:hypothetical protein